MTSSSLHIECCMSGCAVCVYDLYEESLAAYKEKVEQLRTKLQAMGIPQDDWPLSIMPDKNTTGKKTHKGAVVDAFEAFERSLENKSR